MEWWKRTAIRLASGLGYPAIFRSLVNVAPVDVDIRLDSSARIDRGAKILGNVRMGPGARIKSGGLVRGRLELDRHAMTGPDVVCRGDVSVGPWSNLNDRVEAIGDVTIGGFSPVARDTALLQRNHNTAQPSLHARFKAECLDNQIQPRTSGPISVGSDVWIGRGVTVLSGVSIAHGAVVGAGSVVTEDVDPFSVVAGVPAEHKTWRFDEETREALLDIAWWEWDDEKLRDRSDFFTTDLTEVENVYEHL